MTSREQIAEVIRAAYAARVRGDVEACVAQFADDATFGLDARGAGHEAMLEPARGKAQLRAMMQALVDGFQFDEWREIALIVEGDVAALHWRARATVRATGRSDVFDTVDVIRMRGDKIVGFHQSFDTARLNRLMA
ncbi:MAG: nuclear transport factor 2 family protein [Methylobacteriaceae bacterium]|nr:nuclear transport factor 2 family protein [Methylobacteriaceae bacterium]